MQAEDGAAQDSSQSTNPKDGAKAKGKGKDKGARSAKAKSQPSGPKVAQVAEASAPAAGEQAVPLANPTEELLRETTEVLRAMKLKALHQMYVQRLCGEKLGLLDTGATASMRRGSDEDFSRYPRRTIALAVGEVELAVNEAGTLLADADVEPSVCAADLVAMGC